MYAGLIPFLMPLLDSPRFFGAMLTVKGLERVSVADRGGGGGFQEYLGASARLFSLFSLDFSHLSFMLNTVAGFVVWRW